MNSMYLLRYKHHGSIRTAVFELAYDARAWGEYCFHHLTGCTGADVIALKSHTTTWKVGQELPQCLAAFEKKGPNPLDWNHNER